MNTKPLIDYFNAILPLDEEEIAFVQKVFKGKRVKREADVPIKGGQVTLFMKFINYHSHLLQLKSKVHVSAQIKIAKFDIPCSQNLRCREIALASFNIRTT